MGKEALVIGGASSLSNSKMELIRGISGMGDFCSICDGYSVIAWIFSCGHIVKDNPKTDCKSCGAIYRTGFDK